MTTESHWLIPLLIRFLDPELIHRGKGPRVLGLERVPKVEIRERLVLRKTRPIAGDRAGVDIEADELQAVLREEALDLRDRQPMLLDVEQQIAACAGAEEIAEVRNLPQWRVVAEHHELLATSAN